MIAYSYNKINEEEIYLLDSLSYEDLIKKSNTKLFDSKLDIMVESYTMPGKEISLKIISYKETNDEQIMDIIRIYNKICNYVKFRNISFSIYSNDIETISGKLDNRIITGQISFQIKE